jgi:hypothetical protein
MLLETETVDCPIIVLEDWPRKTCLQLSNAFRVSHQHAVSLLLNT